MNYLLLNLIYIISLINFSNFLFQNLSAERLKTSVESCLSNFRKIAPRTSATTVTDKTNCPAATPPTVDCDNNDNAGDNSNQEYYVQIKQETRNNLQNSTSFVHDNNSVSGQETDIQVERELVFLFSNCVLQVTRFIIIDMFRI